MEELQQEMVLLFWLIGINGAPILFTKFAGKRFDYPIDGHQSFRNGRSILGPSKTFRSHADRIMIAQNAVDVLFQYHDEPLHSSHCAINFSKYLSAIIAGQYTNVILKISDRLNHRS